jgi:hypothetical protein
MIPAPSVSHLKCLKCVKTYEKNILLKCKQKNKSELSKNPFKKPWYPCPFEILAEALSVFLVIELYEIFPAKYWIRFPSVIEYPLCLSTEQFREEIYKLYPSLGDTPFEIMYAVMDRVSKGINDPSPAAVRSLGLSANAPSIYIRPIMKLSNVISKYTYSSELETFSALFKIVTPVCR